MHRRGFVCALVVASGMALWPSGASAQGYPNRIIRLVVPFAPGGSNDIVARLIAEKMTDALGQTVVVDNRPGAGGVIGTDSVAKSTPDGYTLMIGATSTMAANPSLYTKMNLDPPKDLTPITQVASGPFVLAVPASLPVRTVKELIALARDKPGEINFGSSGVGSSLQLTAELFKSMANVNIVHVPYKGLAPALADLVTGRIHIIFSDMAGLLPFVQSGQLRALGVTSAQRFSDLSDLPTLAEAGVPGYEYHTWFGLWAPKGTPQPIVDKLNAEVTKALADPVVQQRIAAGAGEPSTMALKEIEPFMKAEIAKWAEVVKRAGIKVE